MMPKHKATAQDKGKGKVSGPSTRTRHVAEPPDDGDIPRFQTEDIKACYTNTWAPKVCHKERQVTRDELSHHLLEHVIQHCGWHKVAGAPYVAYPTLVREFFANFNPDIDVPKSPHRHKTWVRGEGSNINPTRQRMRFNEHQAILLYHLAWLRKIDLGAHIFKFIKELATKVDSQRTIHFSCLISGLCLTQGVSLFPTEEADPPATILNARSVENSETKIATEGNRVQAVPAVNAGEDYPDEAAPAPPLAPAADSNHSIQLAQLLAAQTEMSRAIGTIQGAVLHIQRAQEAVLGDLRVVTSQVGDLQHADAMTRSNQRTFDYQYHTLHDQVSRIGSRIETIDENVAHISRTVSSFSQQLASFSPSASARTAPPDKPFCSTVTSGKYLIVFLCFSFV
ncbi:Uncharacterized protein Adt_27162 [Abeliophyllum distichum]|uniref:Uncharacterized protein n=1 Tax=Abeliophyllum distichum TaxID=126358 RepID=A0ABD1RU45_9LAMI